MKRKANLLLIALVLVSCIHRPKRTIVNTTDKVGYCGNANTVSRPAIFLALCTTCHDVDKASTGPRLGKILERIPGELWFDAFVRNEDSLKRIKDQHTIEIQKWSPIEFTHNFSDLTDQQLKEIKNYLKQ